MKELCSSKTWEVEDDMITRVTAKVDEDGAHVFLCWDGDCLGDRLMDLTAARELADALMAAVVWAEAQAPVVAAPAAEPVHDRRCKVRWEGVHQCEFSEANHVKADAEGDTVKHRCACGVVMPEGDAK